MQTLLSVATEFSGAFRDLQSGKLYSAAELLFWADGNQLAMEVQLVKQKPGVYLVRARDTNVPLYQLLSRRTRRRSR